VRNAPSSSQPSVGRPRSGHPDILTADGAGAGVSERGPRETGGLRIAESEARRGGSELAFVAAPDPEDDVVTTGEATVFRAPAAPAASATLSDQRLDIDTAAWQQGAAFTRVPQ